MISILIIFIVLVFILRYLWKYIIFIERENPLFQLNSPPLRPIFGVGLDLPVTLHGKTCFKILFSEFHLLEHPPSEKSWLPLQIFKTIYDPVLQFGSNTELNVESIESFSHLNQFETSLNSVCFKLVQRIWPCVWPKGFEASLDRFHTRRKSINLFKTV